jgi:hypothetical protein
MYCVETMSYDQPQGWAWVAVTFVAEIPPLVRSSWTNAARATHVCFPGSHSLKSERCVLLRIPKPRIGTQEKSFCAVMMDVVSLLATNSELGLTLNFGPGPDDPRVCM